MRSIAALVAASLALPVGACVAARTGSSAATSHGYAGPRVVTLVPSFADDMYAIGAGHLLVGVSVYTDAPQAKQLPRVGDANGIDAEAIVALRPSVVIGIPAQERMTEALRRAHLRVVLLPDDSYESIFTDLAAIGSLTGRRRQAEATIARLREETLRLTAPSKRYRRKPSVFIVLGSGPIWTAGAESYISTLIALAGGTNAAGDLRAAYGEYSAEALVRRQPDLIVADAALHLDAALDREPWRSLRAVRLAHFYAVNPDLIERPGPKYNEGVRWLAQRVRPLADMAP